MAYTDDAVRAKLSALNETQESIVTVAQWVMFHRRHAERTAALWLQKLKDSSAGKRLNLIYLANEVAQQSKVRRKDDFLLAFSPIIAEATAVAYRAAASEVQAKIRRSVEVWRTRQIFDADIQQAIETRLDGEFSGRGSTITYADLDRSRTSKRPALGGSLFSGSTTAVPAELQPLVPLQSNLSRATTHALGSVPDTIHSDFDTLIAPENAAPPPPVYAAKLSALFKNLATAESAVSDRLKARKALIQGLEKILEINKSVLDPEEAQAQDLQAKKSAIERKKREVEDAIMQGLSAGSAPHPLPSATDHPDGDPMRPAIEELTPPPESGRMDGTPHDVTLTGPDSVDFLMPTETPTAGADLLSSLSLPTMGQLPSGFMSMDKKRKAEDEEAGLFPGLPGDAMSGLDDDVAQMLQEERR